MTAVAPENPLDPAVNDAITTNTPQKVGESSPLAMSYTTEFDEHAQRELVGLDTGTLDNIGLITAFIAAIAVGLLASFSYDDLKAADLRCFNSTIAGGCGIWYPDPEHYISQGFGWGCCFSAPIAVFSMFCSIVARSILPLLENLNTEGREKVAKFLRPMIAVALGFLVVSVHALGLVLYIFGFITMQVSFAGSIEWLLIGGWILWICSPTLICVTIYLKFFLLPRLKKTHHQK